MDWGEYALSIHGVASLTVGLICFVLRYRQRKVDEVDRNGNPVPIYDSPADLLLEIVGCIVIGNAWPIIILIFILYGLLDVFEKVMFRIAPHLFRKRRRK